VDGASALVKSNVDTETRGLVIGRAGIDGDEDYLIHENETLNDSIASSSGNAMKYCGLCFAIVTVRKGRLHARRMPLRITRAAMMVMRVVMFAQQILK
ncbi:hypothetical protein HPP92_013108, partial [Vanilla planifolia]